MAIKYINIFQSKALQNLPKLRIFCFEKKPSGNPARSRERKTVSRPFPMSRQRTTTSLRPQPSIYLWACLHDQQNVVAPCRTTLRDAQIRLVLIWDRCYAFKNIFAEKFSENMSFMTQTKASFCKNCDHNIGFWEKRQFFLQKWAKIAENCDHNIDPWSRDMERHKKSLLV
jgi:hypothetical protein